MYTYKIFDSFTKECEEIFNNKEVKFNLTFFQHIEYIKEITKCNKSKLKIVVIYNDNLVLTILPFEIKKYFFVKVLQWIGTKYSDYCNPILSKNLQSNINKKYFLDIWSLILNDMKNDLDLIFLNNQLSLINEQPNPFVDYFQTSEFSTVYNINFDGNFNDYKEKIGIKDKKHASKFTTRIQDITDVINGRYLDSEDIVNYRPYVQTFKLKDLGKMVKDIVKQFLGRL